MLIYKNLDFQKWALRNKLTDDLLVKAVDELTQGIFDANLGGSIYKKRVAIGGRGKRGGGRTILAFKQNKDTFFIYAFKKGVKDNVTDRELKALKALAKLYFSYSENELMQAVKACELFIVEKSNG